MAFEDLAAGARRYGLAKGRGDLRSFFFRRVVSEIRAGLELDDRSVLAGNREPGFETHILLQDLAGFALELKALGGLRVPLLFAPGLGLNGEGLLRRARTLVHALLGFTFEHV